MIHITKWVCRPSYREMTKEEDLKNKLRHIKARERERLMGYHLNIRIPRTFPQAFKSRKGFKTTYNRLLTWGNYRKKSTLEHHWLSRAS